MNGQTSSLSPTEFRQSASIDAASLSAASSSVGHDAVAIAGNLNLVMKVDTGVQTVDVHCNCCHCINNVNNQYKSVSGQVQSFNHSNIKTTVQCSEQDIPELSQTGSSNPVTNDTQTTTADSQLTDVSFDPANVVDFNTSDESDYIELSDNDIVDSTNITDIFMQSTAIEQTEKYLVFDSELLKLFQLCPDCKSDITDIKKHTTGTMLTVISTCANGHVKVWRSQPCIRRMPAGNLLLAAAIVLSGCTYSQIKKLCNVLHTPLISKSSFFRIQNTYINPAVSSYWSMHQTAIMSVLSEQDLKLCGDARSDSPGFNAKFSSYSLMDMATSLIVDQQLVALNEPNIPNSVSMETEALDRSLEFVISSGLKIHTLATDRHTGVQSLLKENYPDIKHQFDVWHVAKNVTKNSTKNHLKERQVTSCHGFVI